MRNALLAKMPWLFAIVLALGLIQAQPAGAADREMDATVRQTLADLYDAQPAAKDFANRAKAILVFPNFGRGGLILGGGFGRGAMIVNGRIVEYYRMFSGSIGLQAGYQERDVVIMFMTDEALNDFRQSDGWQLGIDASFALVDAGQGGSVTAKGFTEPVAVFVNNLHGAMVSLALEGNRIVKAEN